MSPASEHGDAAQARADGRERFRLADAAAQAFGAATGLACPPGCGACCLAPEAEASVSECLPLAERLVREGRGEATLTALEARESDPRCFLYRPEAEDERRGRCAEYELRPLVCRLFGFAGRTRKDGARELMACPTMAVHDPAGVAAARAAVEAGLPMPLFAEHGMGLAAADSGAARPLPINRALRLALERSLLAARLAALAAAPP